MTRKSKLTDLSEDIFADEEPTIKVTPKKTQLVVENCSALNIRTEPSPASKVVDILKKDSIVELISYDKDWALIRTTNDNPVEGYAMKYFLGQV